MNFCFNCGTRLLEENQKFCIKCGTKLKEVDPVLESVNSDGNTQITNYHDYFDHAFDDDLIESESKANESVFLSVDDMESNTFLKVEEGFDYKDMDKVFNHLKAKAHERDQYQINLIHERNKKREEYYSYDPYKERQRILDEDSEEDREPI